MRRDENRSSISTTTVIIEFVFSSLEHNLSVTKKVNSKPGAACSISTAAMSSAKEKRNLASNNAQEKRNTGLQIKQLQESALATLPKQQLYIGLWIRGDPPVLNDFHWAFYHHPTIGAGTKYHIKNLGDGWVADHQSAHGVFKDLFLCVLIAIGTIPEQKQELLEQTMSTYDNELESTRFTCRTWLFEIMTLLVKAEILRCDSLEDLQRECYYIGNQFKDAAAKNEQPRPVVYSRYCSGI